MRQFCDCFVDADDVFALQVLKVILFMCRAKTIGANSRSHANISAVE